MKLSSRTFLRLAAGVAALVVLTSVFLFGPAPFVASARAETEIEKLIARAKEGDVNSQFSLGKMYYWLGPVVSDGSRIEQNLAQAIFWFKQAAKQHNNWAKALLGELYAGKSVNFYDFADRDDALAAEWFREIIRSNDNNKELVKFVHYQLGMLLYQECAGYLISLTCGRHSSSPPQDYKEASRLFQVAAKEGHRDSQFQLATMYEGGRGVLQDFAQAAKLYEVAAEAREEQAYVKLGALYVRMENLVLPHMWFNLGAAAAPERPQPAERRDALAKRMTAAQVVEAQRLARQRVARRP